MARVFVYGTFKRGFVNHALGMTGLRFLGQATTVAPYPLVVAGRWFSPVLIDEPGNGHRVAGEVYAAEAADLARLDRLEGTHLSGGYRRVRLAVVAEAAPFEAWSWVKGRPAAGMLHRGPMAVYDPDPEYVPPERRGD